MYGFVCLGGVVAAWGAERWLDTGSRRWVAVAVVAATTCAFVHATGVIVLIAALRGAAVPTRSLPVGAPGGGGGRARAVRGALGAHALTWRNEVSTYPKASLSWLSIVVNETIAAVPANRWIVLPLLVGGGVLIVLRRDVSSRVWLVMAAAPVALLYAGQFRQGVLSRNRSWPTPGAPRSPSAPWSVPASGRSCSGPPRFLVALMVVPYTHLGVDDDEGAGRLLTFLDDQVGPGDAIGVTPPQHDSATSCTGTARSCRALP